MSEHQMPKTMKESDWVQIELFCFLFFTILFMTLIGGLLFKLLIAFDDDFAFANERISWPQLFWRREIN